MMSLRYWPLPLRASALTAPSTGSLVVSPVAKHTDPVGLTSCTYP